MRGPRGIASAWTGLALAPLGLGLSSLRADPSSMAAMTTILVTVLTRTGGCSAVVATMPKHKHALLLFGSGGKAWLDLAWPGLVVPGLAWLGLVQFWPGFPWISLAWTGSLPPPASRLHAITDAVLRALVPVYAPGYFHGTTTERGPPLPGLGTKRGDAGCALLGYGGPGPPWPLGKRHRCSPAGAARPVPSPCKEPVSRDHCDPLGLWLLSPLARGRIEVNSCPEHAPPRRRVCVRTPTVRAGPGDWLGFALFGLGWLCLGR